MRFACWVWNASEGRWTMVRQGVLGLAIMGLCAALVGQQSAPLNFFASAGSCEMDFGKDGLADGWSMFHEGLAPEHTSLSLDSGIRFAGTASQRVRLQKSGGIGGRFVIHEDVEFTAYLTPSVGPTARTTRAGNTHRGRVPAPDRKLGLYK